MQEWKKMLKRSQEALSPSGTAPLMVHNYPEAFQSSLKFVYHEIRFMVLFYNLILSFSSGISGVNT